MLKKKLFFHDILTLFFEAYMEFLFAIFLYKDSPKFNSYFNIVFSIVLAIILGLILPIIVYASLKLRLYNINPNVVLTKWSVIYEGLSRKKFG